MAEGLFRKATEEAGVTERYPCSSAGLCAETGATASENAVLACKELGIDLSAHRARRLAPEDFTPDTVFAVMGQAPVGILKAAGVPGNRIYVLGDPIADPYGGSLETYRICRDQLSAGIKRLLTDLEALHAGS